MTAGPQQIGGRLPIDHPGLSANYESYPWIYQERQGLIEYVPQAHKRSRRKKNRLSKIPNQVDITERPRKREDHEYVHKGTCSAFMFVEPLGGRSYVSASAQRTRKDWAREVTSIVSEPYPLAEKMVLGMDDLNTRSSWYETFPAREAFEIA